GSPDRVVAYRADYRWVESFKPLRLEKSQPGTLPLKEKGVYIITGGLGTIGMVLAEYLAKTFKARLILTGRSNFPARQEWTGWSKETTGGNVSQQVQRLLEMEAAGAEILVIKADVSNPGQMQAVFHQAEEKFGPINGVIHAAGNVGEKFLCPLKDMGKPEAQLHFEPKIYGLLILEELLKDRAVDFCLLMSSTAALLGGLGYGAYAAANQFMDAYMYLLNRSSRTRWLSIDWDSWRMEEEIGEKALGAKIKESAITPPQGVEIFERILGWPRAKQVVGCMGDLRPRIDRWVKLQGLHSPGVEAETRPREGEPLPLSRRPRPHLSTLYLPPQRSREKEVAEIWAELLGCEQIGVQDNFFELNGDSLKAVIAISKIHKQTDVKVPLKDFFANPTVAGVVQYIERAMGMTYSAIEPIEKKAYYPLSSAQKRLYIYQQLQPDSTAYNMPAVYRLTGNIDKEKFQGIFVKMIQRHEALRTAFLTSNGEMIQTIAGCCDFNMTYWELDEAEALARIPDLVKPFDLSRAPLLRVVLIHVQEQNYIIFVDIHHIISDRGSMEIIIDNIARFYQGENIKPLNVQYKDYVTRLAKQLNSETFQAQEKYWLNRLQGLIYTMFPGDYLKSKGRINGGIRDQEIDPGFYHKIDCFCTKHNVTKFIFLITAF
ncbi:MAG TPA: SDR family NAD(P)-dependent oxidoreductase, partial [Candidatus Deferrimicrobium sp.]|nr:SDR family NAD(P)-dependent oxidoreductase [Candidatus Deferrimicrobium sp.]